MRNKTKGVIGVIIGCLIISLISCKKLPGPYSNLSDTTTRAIKTNIIQIETGRSSPGWVKVYLSVTNQNGTPLENFTVANFEVTEGTIPVKLGEITLASFEESGQPIATPLIMDYSGSMSGQPIRDMETAVKSFIGKMQTPDKGEIIKFSSYVEVVQPFTTDKNLLIAAVDRSWPGAGHYTALWDALYTGITDATGQTGLRAVLGFTDGYENASSHTWSQLIQHALSSKIAIYSIGLGNCDSIKLKTLSDTTGGRSFYAPTSEELKEIYDLISGQIRKCYTLKWNVKSQPGQTVQVKIKTTYECANGTFECTSTGSFVAP
ncbi:MAG: VWA domain-containing protein [candidate division WOR-3 bacterium]